MSAQGATTTLSDIFDELLGDGDPRCIGCGRIDNGDHEWVDWDLCSSCANELTRLTNKNTEE